MQHIWPFILSSIAGFSTVLGSLLIFLPIKKIDNFITFSISLSLSVMLGISVLDLIPNALLVFKSSGGVKEILLIIFFFTMGIFLVNIPTKIIKKSKKNTNSLYLLGILNFIALILHNFPEGILTFMSTYKDFSLGLSLCLAITIHNIPEGISISVPIYYATNNKWKAIKETLLAGLAEPIGAFLAFILLKKYITNEIISIFLVIVAGIMVTLSINEMLPEALSYQRKKPLYYGFIIGLLIVIISVFVL